ncbi:hypothetical protein J2Z32_000386 [Paenibacillus turicensis]|uniref:Delta-aminolevulinic acid dehydratase n=1 Tax=Paenibacillus turicensis TaxID=160487 RepID=A0ABS4FMG3_9BACL|nr:delta-aminolevulinic acid dehydratase [Paenibacillus turicensis]MBP1903774.1 hypothetical protein [Paenibacillus turicensis]
MSKPEMNVAIVCGPNCDLEVQAIRSTLEYLGARVFVYWVGRPLDFISVLSGDDLYPDTDFILLCFHGVDGQFVMPELAEEIYETDEPRGDFGVDQVVRYANLEGKVVLANGCTLGLPETAKAFLQAGCKTYIGPDDYPDGNMALMFALRLFYELIQNKKSVQQAFHLTQAMDEEMKMYRLYE